MCECPASIVTGLLYRAPREIFLESKHDNIQPSLNISSGPLSPPAWAHTPHPGKYSHLALLTHYQQLSPLLTCRAAPGQWTQKLRCVNFRAPSVGFFRSKYTFVLKNLQASCLTESASEPGLSELLSCWTMLCSFSSFLQAHFSRDILSPAALSELSAAMQRTRLPCWLSCNNYFIAYHATGWVGIIQL